MWNNDSNSGGSMNDRDRSMRLKLAIEEMLKDIDMSGEEWNDRDKDGVAYWEKWNKND